MVERIPQTTTIRIPLQAYLSTDHITPATGKTIAITISKNGAAYGNPSGGATNAVEIASGSYYVDLSTTDTGTLGPLFILGQVSGVDNVVAIYDIVKATNGGLSALPDTAATTNASLLTSGTGTAQIDVTSGRVNLGKILDTAVSTPATAGVLDVNVKNMNNVAATSITAVNANQGTTQPVNFTGAAGSALVKSDTVDIAGAAVSTGTAQIGVNVVTQANIDFGALQKASLNAATPASVLGAVGSVTGNVGGNVAGSVGSVTGLNAALLDAAVSTRLASASYTAPDNADIVLIKAKTDNLPASPAAVGSAMTLTSGERISIAGVVSSTAMTEAYSAVGAVLTPASALYQIVQQLGSMSISGTTMTVKKRDESTTAKTFTLNSSTAPSSITEAS